MKTTKTILISFIALFAVSSLFAQEAETKKSKSSFLKSNSSSSKVLQNNFTFNKSTAPYNLLSGATSVNNNQIWDDPEYIVPIGFDFDFYGITMDSVYFSWSLGGSVTTVVDANYNADYIIAPFEVDLIDRGDISGVSMSPISYKLEGNAGSRIFKLEWKNVGFYLEADSLGTLNDYINYQLWLYEGTNIIEFRYGMHSITYPDIAYDGASGGIIGLADASLLNAYLLTGPASSPVMVDTFTFINGTPAAGTIYRFTPTSNISINSQINNDVMLKAFPNPFQNKTTIKISNTNINNAELTIVDAFGKTVRVISNIQSNEITIERAELANGIYFFSLTEKGELLGSGKLLIN